MQLRKLEAYGFKSFADKLDIEFDKGITAIVGPNGSGKSNITDAIRWVMGEQNVRSLRGVKTEDIIFSGSATRRALGIAEVSLTFDNSDGSLPLDFQEVVITRRLFRSGESEFYINKARCRLKDIYDLFADTGLGKDAISVISQNKIDQVLNSRPEERRLLFEETAGITKYRNRKKESLRKLDDTEQNILRVTDILAELERQLGPLAEHAEKTRKYNTLHAVYKQCKVTVLVNRYEEQKRALEECEKQKKEIEQANQNSGVQIHLLEVEKERANNELVEVEKSLQLLMAKNSALSEKIEKNNSDLLIFQERVHQSDETQTRFQDAAKNARAAIAIAEEKHGAAARESAVATAKAAQIQCDVDVWAAQEAKLQARIREMEAELEQRKQTSFAQLQQLLRKRSDIDICRRDLDEIATQRTQAQAQRELFSGQLQLQQEKGATLQQETEETERLCTSGQAQKQALADGLQAAAQTRQRASDAMQQAAQTLQAAQTRLQFLRGMQEEYEGFGRAVRGVLKNNLPWHKAVCGAVAEVIGMDRAHITAVEIALGGALQNVITESDAAAKEAIAFLKKEKLGRVTFLPRNTIVAPQRRKDPEVVRMPGFIGYASDLVTCEEKYRAIVDFLLARTIVVDHVDTALKLARQQNYRARIVTLDGEMLYPGGSMSGGFGGRKEASFLNRAGEIAALEQRVGESAAALRDAEGKAEAAAEAFAAQELALKRHEATLQQLEIKRAQQGVYLEKAAAEYAAITAQLAELETQAARAEAKRKALEAAKRQAAQEVESLEAAESLQKEGDQALAQRLAKLHEEKATKAQELVERKIARTVAEQELIRADENARAFQEEIARGEAELQRLAQETQNLQTTVAALKERLAAVGKENEDLKALKSIGVKGHDHFHQVKLEKLVKLQENDQEVRNLRKAYNDLQSKVHQLDISYTKYAFEVNACEASLQSDYGLSVGDALLSRIREGTAVLHRRIESLQREMDALGSINPNAIEEYKAVSERYGFMKKQADDLIVAKEYLMGIVKEIDATMSKQFTAAFAQINTYFGEIFERLFGGGQASLVLSDERNVLEAGIEINVQPPNKKLQSLGVLSGGERALTVIALLFSFLRYRPAPFSVVDEIDAPLDEANVDRFGAFLREYAENTQFIVVTHRKGTMQIADVMHGVTVEDSGVSKIISVKLEEQADEKAEE